MPGLLPLVTLLAWSAPEAEEERGLVEAGVAAEVLYPPKIADPRVIPSYEIAAHGSIHTDSGFKAMLGFAFDHVVGAWLGDPENPNAPRRGPWAGTLPASFRGQLFRMTPQARLGIENEVAYGYFGLATGYALRVASLTCVDAPCRTSRTVEHGLDFGVSLGALVSPAAAHGFTIGGEVGLDWAWFPKGHPELAPWNQSMSARLIAGWRF